MRVLVAAPTRRDAKVTCGLLDQAGIAGEAFADLADLAAAISPGAGALVLTDVALASSGISDVLARAIAIPVSKQLGQQVIVEN